MARRTRSRTPKAVENITHEDAKRLNLPSAEHQTLLSDEETSPLRVAYQRRNRDLDPQLVWRGKDEQDLSDLTVNAPPLYIQERVHPKVLVDDLMRETKRAREVESESTQPDFADLFADFNGLPSEEAKTEFYQHDANWSNRMVLGDSLQVMASLAEREGLRGKVQCIYIDPPYGIKFNSNFQWSTRSRDVRDGNASHITREPEQVKAFRDTWRDGIHSYLTYLRDRLTVARDLLTESGSIFVQIGDENVHRVRALMDEVFGEEHFVSSIWYRKNAYDASNILSNVYDTVLWYSKTSSRKVRRVFRTRTFENSDPEFFDSVQLSNGSRRQLTKQERDRSVPLPSGSEVYARNPLTSAGSSATSSDPHSFEDQYYQCAPNSHWKTTPLGMARLLKANRIAVKGTRLRMVRFITDNALVPMANLWGDTGTGGFVGDEKLYIVQTDSRAVERCILMTTDPGDLVLDPTCGSGTAAYVAEQWGRRWITIDTSRVALALARARVMGARYPYYLLSDSPDGREKMADLTGRERSQQPAFGDIRQGFVYERVPHITLRDIANNSEIDVIWEEYEERLEPLRQELSTLTDYRPDQGGEPATGNQPLTTIPEWEVPRDFPEEWPPDAMPLHEDFWQLRIERQKQIDDSIARNAQFEYLYDKPYEDRGKVRVAGPFSVESVSPHRMLEVDENDQVVDRVADPSGGYGTGYDFAQIILDNLKTSGVQQAHREDRIEFDSLAPWPGRLVCAEGRYTSGQSSAADEQSHAAAGVTSDQRRDTNPESPTPLMGESLPRTRSGGLSVEDPPWREGDKVAPGSPLPDGPRQVRAAIFIGPEFGTVTRPDLVEAAREAAEAEFDVLIACAFNYEAHTTEFENLGRVRVLKARMNADLHMATDLKNTGSGNLFVIFGEPDIDILDAGDNQVQVRVNGVDVFHPQTGEVRSDGPDGIACWFIDTDYNEEAFFVRHAYFLGANDPYRSLKTTLKAEIDAEAWESLHSDISRPFERPESGRIAVKVINNLGDEVMKVFRVR